MIKSVGVGVPHTKPDTQKQEQAPEPVNRPSPAKKGCGVCSRAKRPRK
jgi:hypothetical protein